MRSHRVVSFRDLEVWQESMELVVDCYTLLEISERLDFVTAAALSPVRERLERVGRMLHALEAALERRLTARAP